MNYAIKCENVLVKCKVFNGWTRVVREERIKLWEKERQARKHNEK